MDTIDEKTENLLDIELSFELKEPEEDISVESQQVPLSPIEETSEEAPAIPADIAPAIDEPATIEQLFIEAE